MDALYQTCKKIKKVRNMRMWKKIVHVLVIITFPFVLEWFLFITPEVSRFSNEIWFSFIGSYSSAIVTLLVLCLTLRENRNSIREERRKLRESFDIESEINLSRKILDVLLLNRYDFISADKLLTEYGKYRQDMYDIQFEVRELKYDDKGDTARDRFLKRLFLTERYHTFKLIELNVEKIDNIEKAKKLSESIDKNVTEMVHQMNKERRELLNLYKEYVHEMKEKEFE